MALKIGSNPASFTGLLKEGYKQFDEAILRNIKACKDICDITKTSFGPYGMNKMIVNSLEKLFVTSDAATILKELEVVHPAAKLLVMNSRQQEQENGDGTNLTLVLTGELLQRAEDLIRIGMHPGDVIHGYELAVEKALSHLDELVVQTIGQFNEATLRPVIRTAISTKQYGMEDFLTELVIQSTMMIIPPKPKNFNIDSIRIVKIMGGNASESKVIPGMVFHRQPESKTTYAQKAQVAVYACPIDIGRTETKGTVLIKDAEQLLSFSKGEEALIEQQISDIAACGVTVLVTGQTVGDLALHYANQHNLVVVKIPSKFDLQRLCRVIGATAMARLGAPTQEELGFCDIVEVVEIGGDRCTVFRQEQSDTKSRTCTILLRGNTMNHLDDLERAIDDGIHTIKSLTLDGRLVPGAGSTEIELAESLTQMARVTPGLAQYGIQKFAEALEVVPRLLSEHLGALNQVACSTSQVISHLYALHRKGQKSAGVNIDPISTSETEDSITLESCVLDAVDKGILDVYRTKRSALHLAVDAALSVLRVDMIIMSKPAGGPKPRQPTGGMDADED